MDNVVINITQVVPEVEVNICDPCGGGGGGTQDLEQVLTVGNDGGGLQIKNIADPTDDQDAATKKYVDDNAGGGSVDSVTGTADRIVITGTATDPVIDIASAYDTAITAEIAAAIPVLNGFNGVTYSGLYKSIGNIGSLTQAASFVVGSVYAGAYIITKNHSINQLAIKSNANVAGKNIRLGIYNDNNGYCGTLIEDSGNISTAASGILTYTLASPLALTTSMKVVWLVFMVESTSINLSFFSQPSQMIRGNFETGDTLRYAGSFGALPANLSAVSPAFAAWTPAIAVRVV